METTTIRTALPSDAGAIEALAVAAEMFEADDVGFLGEIVRQAGAGEHAEAQWRVAEQNGELVGAAYYAPEPFADRMWNLYFIAVAPTLQGGGVGSALMGRVEHELRERGPSGARTLMVETSSTDKYALTREFYAKLGYAEEARIRQFYGPDDDKVVFWKSLATDAPEP